MNEILFSPGVSINENDTTIIPSIDPIIGSAIIGPTVKGTPLVPKKITSYPEYVTYFGDSFEYEDDNYSFLTSIAAKNYFENSGTALLVTRIVSGSNYTPANSTFIESSGSNVDPVFTLETLGHGDIYNSSGSESSKGGLENGTEDNFRWEITNVNEKRGTFTLLIRRGNDSHKSKSIIETFPNISLDPTSSNYISRIIGDVKLTPVEDSDGVWSVFEEGNYPNRSRFIRVSGVNLKTPKYINNDGTVNFEFTSSLPTIQSGSFDGAVGEVYTGTGDDLYEDIGVNTQGLIGSDYNKAIDILSSQNEYKFKVLITPGLTYNHHPDIIDNIISVAENTRKDFIYITDLVGFGSTVNNVIIEAENLDSTYTATYWPWVQINHMNQLVWVPGSTLMLGVYANSDNLSEPWWSPAGLNRGGLESVRQAERKLKKADRDQLYLNRINPLATLPGRPVSAYGQKTLQLAETSLSSINVRRLLIELKEVIGRFTDTILFEPNTQITRNQFLSFVNPYLESIQERQGITSFNVVMDDTNNNNTTIDRLELHGAIYIQPTRAIEYIYLEFNLTPTGVEFV